MKYTNLSAVAEYVREKISSTKCRIDQFVTTDSLLQDKQGRTAAKNLPPKATSLTKFEPGDVLIANIRPYLKKIWRADISGGCSPDVLVFRAKPGHSSDFLYALLLQDSFFDHAMIGKKGAKMPRGDKAQIMTYPVPLLEPEEEARIGDYIAALMQKAALNNQLIRMLEEQAQLVYDYWFMQFDFPDENGKPYRSSGGKMAYDAELGLEIPEGWRGATLNVVAEMAAGARKDDDYEMYLSTDDMLQNKQGIVFSTKRAPGAGGITSHPHDTLISNIRPYLKKIWYSDMESSVSADVLIFRSKTNHPGFLYFTLRRDEFFAHMMTGAKGAKMPRGDKHQINRYPIALPADMSTVAEYEAYVQLILAKIASASRENRLLTEQRDFLLPLLMSGQVTVAE